MKRILYLALFFKAFTSRECKEPKALAFVFVKQVQCGTKTQFNVVLQEKKVE